MLIGHNHMRPATADRSSRRRLIFPVIYFQSIEVSFHISAVRPRIHLEPSLVGNINLNVPFAVFHLHATHFVHVQ